jgi:RNA polymerase sigma-70 factor (ECF subfamily)
LCAALAADLDAHFEALVLAYQDRLYRFALRLTNQPQEAEDIAQEAFVKAYRALRRFSADRWEGLHLRAWLYQIALNTFRNRLRAKSPPVTSTEDLGDGGEPFDLPADEADRPEALAERAELHARLAAQVAALPPRHREAITLRFIEGLGYAEMAEVLKQPLGTVKANVHRALETLRRKVYGENYA